MNHDNNYVIFFWQLSYEGLHLSYIWNEMFANMYEFMIHIYRIYNVFIGLNISDNYVIFVSTRFLGKNELITQFQTIFNARLSE